MLRPSRIALLLALLPAAALAQQPPAPQAAPPYLIQLTTQQLIDLNKILQGTSAPTNIGFPLILTLSQQQLAQDKARAAAAANAANDTVMKCEPVACDAHPER